MRITLIRAGFGDDDDARHDVLVALDDVRPRARVLALRAGARRGWITESRFAVAVSDPDSDVRRECASLLSGLAPMAGLESKVIDALDDDDPLVVDAAAFCLGEWLSVNAVPALMSVGRDHDDARCRESAIAALGAIGDDRARVTIIAALDDKPPIRRRAIVALSNFEGPDIDDALRVARDDRDWQVRAAVEQLEREPLDED